MAIEVVAELGALSEERIKEIADSVTGAAFTVHNHDRLHILACTF
jgi:hypothetical protein